MFEKYNEKARRALFFARYEASKLGSRVIESEHILLGILREGEDTVSEIFRRFHVKPDEIRREIEGERVFVERISSTAELPLSEESKKILAYASHEAESMLHPTVGLRAPADRHPPGRGLPRRCASSHQHGFDVYGVREEVISHHQGARGLAAEEGAAVPRRVRPRPDRARRRAAPSTR